MGNIKKIFCLTVAGVFAVIAFCAAEEVETNAFGYPMSEPIKLIDNTPATSDIESVKNNTLPDCNDPELLAAIARQLSPIVSHNDPNIIEKRNADLLLKNIASFDEVDISELSPRKHRLAAARVVELKINNRIPETDIRVCKSNSPEIKDAIYAVVYNLQKQTLVALISVDWKLSDFALASK